jgi:hypothetical protein
MSLLLRGMFGMSKRTVVAKAAQLTSPSLGTAARQGTGFPATGLPRL